MRAGAIAPVSRARGSDFLEGAAATTASASATGGREARRDGTKSAPGRDSEARRRARSCERSSADAGAVLAGAALHATVLGGAQEKWIVAV